MDKEERDHYYGEDGHLHRWNYYIMKCEVCGKPVFESTFLIETKKTVRKEGYRAGLAAALKALEEWRDACAVEDGAPSTDYADATVNAVAVVKALLEEKPKS